MSVLTMGLADNTGLEPTTLVGRPAPDFELPCTSTTTHPERVARLGDYRGRWLILIFYPRDFSLVCPTEISAMSNRYEELLELGADVLAVSTDTLESHEQWIATPDSAAGLGAIAFPLGSDTDSAVSRAYHSCLDGRRVALRGLYIIDPNSIVQYQVVHSISVGRRTEEVVRVLQALQTGGLCAENWSRGPAIDPAEELRPGSVVSHFRIEQKIGEGGFSAVYRAHDRTLERQVAVKVLRRQDERTAAALSEARNAAALNHPNLCTVYSVDSSEGLSLIVMELLSGRTLQEIVRDGPMPTETAIAIARQMAAGMAAAHDAGIVHGDLKPDNVMVTDEEKVKILDFGMAARHRTARDNTLSLPGPAGGTITGTPAYMSPEQTDGHSPTKPSDIFSFGLVLYELLAGRPAFRESNLLRVLKRIRSVNPDDLAADVGEPFRPLLCRMLARRPTMRAITMREVERTLARRKEES